MSKKVVLMLDILDGNDKRKAMKAASKLPGIEYLEVKDKKLTVIGEVDPCQLVAKLREYWHTEIVTVGPAEEENNGEPAGNIPRDEEEMENIIPHGRLWMYLMVLIMLALWLFR